ncbi:unnamed protein product [Chrysodeixis includens]|uniref:Peroxidase n=1 Tax=Chrysodeixis includens TaxID=689277 RepID=A0A9P0C5K5_CHRIL|nr:unnamed protein product [Chrysodeixis includens]
MLFGYLFILYQCTRLSHGLVYDSVTGNPASDSLIAFYQEKGVLASCTVDVKPCVESERRRVDGTCNSLKYPVSGAHSVPRARLLPAVFYNGSYPRRSVSGKELTPPRLTRTSMLRQGKSIHPELTHLVPGFGIFMFSDVGSAHDTVNMVTRRTNCCEKEHMNDYGCTPNIIPDDDPVLRYTNIRCMNSTRPMTFQEFLCTNNSVPIPYATGTPSRDFSQIYNPQNLGSDVIRTKSGGLLVTEVEDGKTWPAGGPLTACPLNQPGETRCFRYYANTLLPASIFIVYFVRFHNYIAKELAAINPGWDDDTLFYTAREINIAASQQIYIYEWHLALQGEDNLKDAGILSKSWINPDGFKDEYDESKVPSITMEYTYAIRWFHLMQESSLKMYDETGNYLREEPMFNYTFRPGFLTKNNNINYATQGLFRQASRAADHSVSFGVSEQGLPIVQAALDITTGDVSKGRYLGMPPYVDYVQLFTNIKITSFQDLTKRWRITNEQVLLLQEIYEDVRDIDLIVGLWAEEPMKYGRIPATLASILNDDILRNRKGDRHLYENSKRPNAMTRDQLKEIRKVLISTVFCVVGDGVTEIQKNAFLTISPENPIVSCSKIPKINFNAWYDKNAQKA